MSEHGEMINEYVAAKDVLSVLDASGLVENEAEKALAVIQHDRAQWVVDSIATELGQRASGLTIRIAGLDAERQQATQDLEVINQTLGLRNKSESRSADLLQLFDKQLSYDSVSRIMLDQSPFKFRLKLGLPSMGQDDIPSKPSLSRWVDGSEAEIISLSNKRFYNTLLKAARAIDHEVRSGTFDSSEFEGKVHKIYSGQEVEMIVDDPYLFFDTLRGSLNGFGYKSMIAIMYLIEYQSKN